MEERHLRAPSRADSAQNRTLVSADTPEGVIERREITAALVEEADRLLSKGVDRAVIAARLGVTEYVLEVMARDRFRNGRPQPRQQFAHGARTVQPGVDAATIRMIQRMLAVGILNYRQIAREAGVSPHIVEQVATGKRPPLSTERLRAFKDLRERFLPEPIRCSVCSAKIAIVPCRACRARRERISSLR
jgi:hypothetical protein